MIYFNNKTGKNVSLYFYDWKSCIYLADNFFIAECDAEEIKDNFVNSNPFKVCLDIILTEDHELIRYSEYNQNFYHVEGTFIEYYSLLRAKCFSDIDSELIESIDGLTEAIENNCLRMQYDLFQISGNEIIFKSDCKLLPDHLNNN